MYVEASSKMMHEKKNNKTLTRVVAVISAERCPSENYSGRTTRSRDRIFHCYILFRLKLRKHSMTHAYIQKPLCRMDGRIFSVLTML